MCIFYIEFLLFLFTANITIWAVIIVTLGISIIGMIFPFICRFIHRRFWVRIHTCIGLLELVSKRSIKYLNKKIKMVVRKYSNIIISEMCLKMRITCARSQITCVMLCTTQYLCFSFKLNPD